MERTPQRTTEMSSRAFLRVAASAFHCFTDCKCLPKLSELDFTFSMRELQMSGQGCTQLFKGVLTQLDKRVVQDGDGSI